LLALDDNASKVPVEPHELAVHGAQSRVLRGAYPLLHLGEKRGVVGRDDPPRIGLRCFGLADAVAPTGPESGARRPDQGLDLPQEGGVTRWRLGCLRPGDRPRRFAPGW
jgi:hypothetical protein